MRNATEYTERSHKIFSIGPLLKNLVAKLGNYSYNLMLSTP